MNGEGESVEAEGELPAQQKRAKLLQGRRKKKRPCEKLMQTGHCRFGERCKFSHDPQRIAGALQPIPLTLPTAEVSTEPLPAVTLPT